MRSGAQTDGLRSDVDVSIVSVARDVVQGDANRHRVGLRGVRLLLLLLALFEFAALEPR